MKIEVSNGELIDKLTILEIKLHKIRNENKRANIQKEYNLLKEASEGIKGEISSLYDKLLEINQKLWNIEDRIRELERRKDFGSEFIETARAVYHNNDQRAKIKHEINQITGSDLVEEKSYEDY